MKFGIMNKLNRKVLEHLDLKASKFKGPNYLEISNNFLSMLTCLSILYKTNVISLMQFDGKEYS